MCWSAHDIIESYFQYKILFCFLGVWCFKCINAKQKTTLCIPLKAYFQVKLFASIRVVCVAYLLFYFLRATAKYKFELKPTKIYYRSFISLPNCIVWIVLMRPFQGQHLHWRNLALIIHWRVVYPFRVDNCHFVLDNRLGKCVRKNE